MDLELEQFKQQISLAAYAESLGYQLDQRESSKNSWVLRSLDDKVVIATNQNGHGIYFSVYHEQDNGTIIDFVQKRVSKNLGEVRKELRKWLTPSPSFSYGPRATRDDKPIPSTKDRQRVIAEYSKTYCAMAENYLTRHRGIDLEILRDARFANIIRTDQKKNNIFPHFDREGLSGFEVKNVGFTGFSAGGCKGLWYTRNIQTASQVLIVESAIDALSHAQLHGGQLAYVSIGGAISDHQQELLEGLITKAHVRSAKVGVGTDNDYQGEIYRKQILNLGSDFFLIPEVGKDWNEELNLSYS